MRANLNLADHERDPDELGPNSAGQSGDLQGISDVADADSESVEELVEEGNAFEAAAVEGVENAKDPDVSEVTTRQVPEDDVPQEYLNDDEHSV
jgi:N utilization substance protein A